MRFHLLPTASPKHRRHPTVAPAVERGELCLQMDSLGRPLRVLVMRRVQAMRDAAVKVRPDILVLCHGGPIAMPEDAQYILENTEGIAGFFGASSIERLPTEPAITNQVKAFKGLSIK